MSFGQLLRQLRFSAMLTQEELAEAAGLSVRSISDLERGINLTARRETARLLADALGLAGPDRARFEAAARGRIPAESCLARLPSTQAAGSCYLDEIRSRIDHVLRESILPIHKLSYKIAIFDDRLARYAPLGFNELFDPPAAEKYVIASEPGSGKSTYLALAADKYLREDSRAIAFLPMSRHRHIGSLTRSLTSGLLDDVALREYLGDGGLVLLDAVDESRAGEVGAVFDEILDWASSNPLARIICTRRSAELPAWVPKEFRRVTILPLDEKAIDRALSDAHSEVTSAGASHLYRLLTTGAMRRLFQNPLLLSMAVAILSDSDLASTRSRIESKVDVYRVFLAWLDKREEQRAHLDDRRSRALLRQRLPALQWIAAKMISGDVVTAGRDQVMQWIAELISLPHLAGSWPSDATTSDFFDILIAAPPLREIEISRAPTQVAFMHPSYGEYLAAAEILREVSIDGRVRTDDLAQSIPHASARSFEVMYYAIGQAPDPPQLFAEMMREATRTRDPDLLRALAHSLSYFEEFPASLADDLVIRILDAFKFWDTPFYYDLLDSKTLISERVSTRFPGRLSIDLQRIERKYARPTPRKIPWLSASDVPHWIKAERDSKALLDVFYTASRINIPGSQRLEVAEAVMTRISHDPDSVDDAARTEGLACLAVLAHQSALEFLHQIAQDRAAGMRSRVYALNGIGKIGQPRSVPLVISVLQDVTDDTHVRDSAAWSLQLLGAAAADVGNKAVLDLIAATYQWCLSVPPVDDEEAYVLGNVLYSIGRLGLSELGEAVQHALQESPSAFVREDAVHTLGQLGTAGSADQVAMHLADPDPVVRAKSAEALGRLGADSYLPALERLCADDTNFVADSALDALAKLTVDTRP